MPSDIYDSDDAMNRSPPLVAQKIKYEVEEPPPPFVSAADRDAPEKSAKGTSDRSRKPHLPESQTQTRHGDSVLISYLAPQCPDIADYARDHPLSLSGWSPKQDGGLDRPKRDGSNESSSTGPRLPGTGGVTRPRSPPIRFPTLPPPAPPPRDINNDPRRPRLLSITAPPDRRTSEDRPRLSPPFKDSTNASPESRVTLPSLQSLQSPASSCAGTLPDTGSANTQVLPSIQCALGNLSQSELGSARPSLPSAFPYSSTPVSATSRNDSPHDRHLPGQFPIPPSPFSHFSPVSLKDASANPSPASQPSFWRAVPPPPPPPAETQPATPYEMSPMTAKSPATNYPTPIEQVPPEGSERGSFSNPSVNGAPGNYKCNHPGCTAPPFQTQYLLNSHANVHSQDRPHFCPVEGCPRAIGGKGFKRKNEMMRHGLVHNSPGYVCPFCPDQQHKYPRPDNLQR
ncbi:hypothetical protein N7492_002352 [Penicillium capsulatum]|uniref:C2H2-type domain-containing protein n=1 Tax=Penicillium capsulatum TaxID=69766 RepID=A0A9W9IJZ2_9EURO|nr:hypothetical protein N7492_002352 [Penicillium capsulatum]KAJ6123043.1 hypothetical protein N7512_005508 [Penicillium capsulatum]